MTSWHDEAPRYRWAAAALLVLGLMHMAGFVTGVKWMRGLAAVTAASPLPKVFSDVDGLETFASVFTLEGERLTGEAWRLSLTPEVYRAFRGPYNRRNVYGAALAYAPRLPASLWEAVCCYGLREGGPVRRELGVPDDVRRLSVVIQTRTRGRQDVWRLAPGCLEGAQ